MGSMKCPLQSNLPEVYRDESNLTGADYSRMYMEERLKTMMKYCPFCGTALAPKDIEGKLRLACTSAACSYVFWDNPTPIVAAIVELQESIILVRNKGWPEKMFGLVSGFLERGETPESAAIREIKEELDLDGSVSEFLGCYSFFEMNQLILAFHIKATGAVTMGEELSEIKYVSPENLRPWPFGTGHVVKDWIEKRKQSVQK
jgi:NAD+ diphosphatase